MRILYLKRFISNKFLILGSEVSLLKGEENCFIRVRSKYKIASRFLEFEDYYIVDSMPLAICKFARHSRIKICKNEFETAFSIGFTASQNKWFYGYNLQGICSVNAIFQSLDITNAEVHEVVFKKI